MVSSVREKVEYYRKKDAPREDPVKDPRRRGNSDDTDVRRHKDQNSKFNIILYNLYKVGFLIASGVIGRGR